MASVTTRGGLQIEGTIGPDLSNEALGMLRSKFIAALRQQGYPSRAVARVMGISQRHVNRLYYDVPAPAREFYGAAASSGR